MHSTDRSALLMQSLSVLCSRASPYGKEGPLARDVIDWASAKWPTIHWDYLSTDDALTGQDSGAVVATAQRDMSSGGLVLYAHLDTSLNEQLSTDRLIVGDGPTEGWPDSTLSHDESTGLLSGAGLAVAKAPAAAALTAFIRAAQELEKGTQPYRLQLLLSTRGTHRFLELPDGRPHHAPSGVTRYLETQTHPDAAVVAKSGPDSILLEEPGAFFLRVRATSQWGVVMHRRLMSLDGGLLRHAGVLVDAMEGWADIFKSRVVDGSSCGHEFGLGVIRSGYAEKPDLVPAMLEAVGYGVMPGIVDATQIQTDVSMHLKQQLQGTAFDSPDVRIDVLVHVLHNGAGTPPDEDIARAAHACWNEVHDTPPAPVQDWKGNTDSVVFRQAGIPAVRIGPKLAKPSEGPVDFVAMAALERTALIYEHLALRCSTEMGLDASQKIAATPT